MLLALEFSLGPPLIETGAPLVTGCVNSALPSLSLGGWRFRWRVRLLLSFFRSDLLGFIGQVLSRNSISGMVQVRRRAEHLFFIWCSLVDLIYKLRRLGRDVLSFLSVHCLLCFGVVLLLFAALLQRFSIPLLLWGIEQLIEVEVLKNFLCFFSVLLCFGVLVSSPSSALLSRRIALFASMRRIFTFWLAKLLWTYSFTHTVRNFVKSDIELFEVDPFNQVTEIVSSDYFVGVLLLCLPTRRSIFKFVMTQHQSFIYTVKFSVYLTAMTLPSAMNLAVIVLHFFCMRFARHTCADIDHVLERL